MQIDVKRFSQLRRLGTQAFVLALVMLVGACQGDYPQSTLDPISQFGRDLDGLITGIFYWALFVFVVVEGALLYTILKFRARPGSPEPKQIHGHTTLEIAWTLAPAVILVFIAVPTIRNIFEHDGTPDAGALQVEVVGHQWWWEYNYPELGITSANELVLPQGRPVALSMTSADVIHSFWMPRVGGKRDVMLGRTTRLAFTVDSTGTYMGQCAEYCGDSHANMRLLVDVKATNDWDNWVASQQAGPPADSTLSELALRGKAAFMEVRSPANHSCLSCHAISGQSYGVLGPNLTHVASRSTIASGVLENTDENLRRWLRNPIEVKPGSLMPDIDLSEDDIDALVAYLQSLR